MIRSRAAAALVAMAVLCGCKSTIKIEPIARALTCHCPAIAVEGIVENRSGNYFSNPQFFLKDASGEVAVRPWLALEVAPYHPDAVDEIRRQGGTWPPETMASYMGVPVRIYGRIEGGGLGGGTPILIVDHAERQK